MSNSVPTFVDSDATLEGIPFRRCTYFFISGAGPEVDWTLQLADDKIPFIMLGLAGVIVGPEPGRPFDDAGQIDRIFDAIEQHPSLAIDSAWIWLPVEILPDHLPGARDTVYRVAGDLFRAAVAFRDQPAEPARFQQLCLENFREHVWMDPVENEAFREWNHATLRSLGLHRDDDDFPGNQAQKLPVAPVTPGSGLPEMGFFVKDPEIVRSVQQQQQRMGEYM